MAAIIDILTQVRGYFHQNLFFGIGVLLLASFFGGKLANRLKFPAITGYILAGMAMGPYMLALVHSDVALQLAPIPHIALGLIALTIGGKFSFRLLRRLGKAFACITILQLLFTFAAVSIALFLMKMPLPTALLLGAIASATAPAATVAVLSEYRARGPLTKSLMAVVALDDAGSIVLFGIILAVCSNNLPGGTALSPLAVAVRPFIEIGGAIVLGITVGFFVHLIVRNRRNRNEIIVIVLGAIFFCSGVAISLHLSPLIANMLAGFVLINSSAKNVRIFGILEPVQPPIYAAFFALAGTELNIRILGAIGILGTAYILARALGKVGGAWLGAVATGASPVTRKYLGLGLLPQAGVAIGLVLLAQEQAATIFSTVAVNIVLASIVFNEIVGPPLTRYAIFKAGEAHVQRPGEKNVSS